MSAAAVLMFHFGRACRTFQAIGLLLAHGFTQDALVLLRTLVEIFYEMAFVARFPEDAPLYLEHAKKLEIAWQDRARSHAPEFMLAFLGVPNEAADRTTRSEWSAHSAWHPRFRTVRKRALAAGVPTIDYDLIYSLGSRYVHGSGDWLREVVKPLPGGVRVRAVATTQVTDIGLRVACSTVVGSTSGSSTRKPSGVWMNLRTTSSIHTAMN